ncbi:hypothetical protein ACJX0J_040490, partial [Zea mays]
FNNLFFEQITTFGLGSTIIIVYIYDGTTCIGKERERERDEPAILRYSFKKQEKKNKPLYFSLDLNLFLFEFRALHVQKKKHNNNYYLLLTIIIWLIPKALSAVIFLNKNKAVQAGESNIHIFLPVPELYLPVPVAELYLK